MEEDRAEHVEFHVGIRVWEGGVTSEPGAFHKWNKPIKGIMQLSWRAQDREWWKDYKCREEVPPPLTDSGLGRGWFLLSVCLRYLFNSVLLIFKFTDP